MNNLIDQKITSLTSKSTPILVLIPTLNEATDISNTIQSMRDQDYEGNIEILVIDGGSTDGTVEICVSECEVEIIHNPKKIQAAAINMGAKIAHERGFEFFIRVDAHAQYERDFVRRLISAYQREKVASVVVPMTTISRVEDEDYLAHLFNAKLGNGGAAHRNKSASGLVNHGHHALMNTQTFLDLGGYDEKFVVNEDAEFDTRLTHNNLKIYLEASARIQYYPKNNLKQLSKQYFKYGKYRCLNFIKHRYFPVGRQILAASIVPLLIIDQLLAYNFQTYPIVSTLYVGAIFISTIMHVMDGMRSGQTIKYIFAAIITHFSYSVGFLSVIWRKNES